MEEQRTRKDSTFAIIAIVAGLVTGGLLTYAFLTPEEPSPDTAQYRVPDEQRVPFDSAEAAGQAAIPDQDPAAAPADPASADPASAADTPAEDDRPSGADRATIEGAQEQLAAEGVTECVELTEELYVRVSAKLVLAATALSEALGPDADPTEAQHLLADKAVEELTAARIDPDEYWAYTRDVHSEPERAQEMGERILREAEKHTRRIPVEDVPIEPTPVPGAPTQ